MLRYVESVGGIDENIPSTSPIRMLSALVHMPSTSISDVESVHLQVPNMLDDDVS
jgi:hypothetical protein